MESQESIEKDANDKIKELAARQKISVNISAEQIEAIQSQWHDWDSNKPAEITFLVDGKTEVSLKVAAYSYSGSTCCAKK